MQINSPWYYQIKKGLKLYSLLLDIQDRAPTSEESESLMIALSELGLSQRMIEANSLLAVHEHLCHLASELTLEGSELSMVDCLIPKSTESTLAAINEQIIDKTLSHEFFFDNHTLKYSDLRMSLKPTDDDTLVDSEVFGELKETYVMILQELFNKIQDSITDQSKIDKLYLLIENGELLDYIINYFDLIDYEELDEMEISCRDLIARYDAMNQDVVTGIETFDQLTDDLFTGIPEVTGTEDGWLDKFKGGLKSASDGFMKAIKSLISFFTGQKKDLEGQKKEFIDMCKENVDYLNSLDKDKMELDVKVIEKTQAMFEKAELVDVAKLFNNINDIPGAITAFNNAISLLDRETSDTKEADKALADAEKAATDVANFNPTLSAESSPEEKSSANDEKKALVEKAKELLKVSRAKVSQSISGLGSLRKLPAIIKGCVKPKPKAEVSGVESWML